MTAGSDPSLTQRDDFELYTLPQCYAPKRALLEREHKQAAAPALQLGAIGTLQDDRHGARDKAVMLIGRRRQLMLPVWTLKFWG